MTIPNLNEVQNDMLESISIVPIISTAFLTRVYMNSKLTVPLGLVLSRISHTDFNLPINIIEQKNTLMKIEDATYFAYRVWLKYAATQLINNQPIKSYTKYTKNGIKSTNPVK